LFEVFNIKALICGLLVASPPLAAWMLRSPESALGADNSPPAAMVSTPDNRTRIPVEVVSKGAAPQWINVEIPVQAVPEPGILPLLLLPGLLLLHRRRP
jgi:hypothetical protein